MVGRVQEKEMIIASGTENLKLFVVPAQESTSLITRIAVRYLCVPELSTCHVQLQWLLQNF